MKKEVTGKIHSIQSMGAVDGPGVRFVVFFQGCPLRCSCCHNPDTWDFSCGEEISVSEIIKRAKRYKEYFAQSGGITLSGGEPLEQAEFAAEIFKECHNEGINTCLDTSGCILNEDTKKLLKHTDRVLLDIKYTDDKCYKKFVGCSYSLPLEFLDYLNEKNIPTTIRQVIIPSINNNDEDIENLKKLAQTHKTVDSIELLPFRKICAQKYENMGIKFPFENMSEPKEDEIDRLNNIISEYIK